MTEEGLVGIECEERKVINEFCHLLEKSKQLFNGLRDMPQVVFSFCNWEYTKPQYSLYK